MQVFVIEVGISGTTIIALNQAGALTYTVVATAPHGAPPEDCLAPEHVESRNLAEFLGLKFRHALGGLVKVYECTERWRSW